MKRFLSIFFAVSLCLSLVVIPSAATNIDNYSETIRIQVFNSEEECQEYLGAYENNASTYTDVTGGLWFGMCRKNGSSDETCQLYINWDGTSILSGIRYSTIKVKASRSIFAKTYITFGNSWLYTEVERVEAGKAGTALIGEVEIPTSVDEVFIDLSEIQLYYNSVGSWSSVSFKQDGMLPID